MVPTPICYFFPLQLEKYIVCNMGLCRGSWGLAGIYLVLPLSFLSLGFIINLSILQGFNSVHPQRSLYSSYSTSTGPFDLEIVCFYVLNFELKQGSVYIYIDVDFFPSKVAIWMFDMLQCLTVGCFYNSSMAIDLLPFSFYMMVFKMWLNCLI